MPTLAEKRVTKREKRTAEKAARAAQRAKFLTSGKYNMLAKLSIQGKSRKMMLMSLQTTKRLKKSNVTSAIMQMSITVASHVQSLRP